MNGTEPIVGTNAQKVKLLHRFGRGTISKAIWSQDANVLVLAASLGAWLYNTTDLNQEPRLFHHDFSLNCVAISPDGATLATGGGSSNVTNKEHNVIYLWDIEASEKRAVLVGHAEGITGLSFSPDGLLLASSSYDEAVRLWNPTNGQEIGVLRGEAGWVMDIAFNADGTLLATANYYGQVIVWDVHSRKRVVSFQHDGRLWAIAFSPDGTTVASSSSVIETYVSGMSLPAGKLEPCATCRNYRLRVEILNIHWR